MKKIIMILLVSALSLLACANNPDCKNKSCDKQACPMEMKVCPDKGDKTNCPEKKKCHSQEKSNCACETKCTCEGKKSCDCKDDCTCPKCKTKK